MDRPQIKDKKVLEYVKDLEFRLSQFQSGKTLAKFYLGLKKQIDDASEMFLVSERPDAEGNMVKFKLMDFDTLNDKDDKFADRYFKFLKDSKPIMENILWLEKQISPESLADAQAEAASLLEEVISHDD